ncbi:MFS general substrate transporter [Aureobasidium sp. EXF-12298]|nr:MFS general substrate transporter [Aureobasidium sp. EXF-12298]KAI4750469.1 MFS general substrate transporter [Aureobasidium sp. EXF-12344]KAI4768660.1 MFS general substrate transporter [Aureobasidium sp. EXF-3400]
MEPIVKATIQAAILSAISNTLAQLISCHRAGHGYSLDTGPLVTFVTFSLLSCPPNYLWQSWLESTFPGYTSPDDAGTVASIAQQPQVKAALDAAAPTLQRIEETASPVLQKASAATTALADSDAVKNARRRASEGVDTVKAKAKELEARAGINQSPMAKPPNRSQTFSAPDGQVVEKKIDSTFAQPPPSSSPKALSIKNTAIKFALDQTLGAAVNNALFIVGIAFLKGQSVETALSALQKDFFPLLFAGQKLWPLVSIISFTLVPLEHRTVFGGIIGVGWGVFLSLMANNK